MKLICDGLDLSDAVLKVSKALPVKSPSSILEGIKIVAENDSLTLSATDLEISIEKKIKADVLMEGSTVVTGKYFIDFVKKLEKEQVELSRLYDSQLQIKYSDNESELQVFDVENFPKYDKLNEDYFEISQAEFKTLVDRTILACSQDDSRPILKGCLFDIVDNNLTVVALDGFRMAVVKKEVKASNNIKAVIPSKTLLEITRLLNGNEEENLKIYIQKNALYVEFDNTIVFSRLIEGEFVKYNHILPNSFENSVVINKQALLRSIERASIVARNDRYNVIKFDINEEGTTISAKSEIGNVVENINCNLTGKDIVIAFNGKYLAEYLKIIDEEFIKINMNTPIDPCVISPVGNEAYLYLVLPVRINA